MDVAGEMFARLHGRVAHNHSCNGIGFPCSQTDQHVGVERESERERERESERVTTMPNPKTLNS